MAQYFEALRPFLNIHPKLNADFIPPKFVSNQSGWKEHKALDLIFGLSGVAYAGMLNALDLSNTDTALNLIKLPEKGNKDRAKIMQSAIEARRLGISCLFPKEIAIAEGVNPDLTLVGLIGLGLMRIILPNESGEAAIKHGVMSILFREDKFASIIREKYAWTFNGVESVRDLIREENIIGLDKRDLILLYGTTNL